MAPWARRLGCVLVMDKCVQMWTRNYGALGQTARVCFGDGQVCPDVDKELWRLVAGCVLALDQCVQMWTRNYGALGQTARVCFGVLCANKKEEVKRDFGDLRIRRSEGRVVNTPLGFKRVFRTEGGKKRGGDPKGEVEKKRRGDPKERSRKKRKRVWERERTEGGGKTEKRERGD
ncbi:hypothetical protein TNCV_2402221 [Trichonephila clavipes]|nr:hypothetical protein TNCV_2402221 [Trichonephila clavipes]